MWPLWNAVVLVYVIYTNTKTIFFLFKKTLLLKLKLRKYTRPHVRKTLDLEFNRDMFIHKFKKCYVNFFGQPKQ